MNDVPPEFTPVLATADQNHAEKTLLQLLQDEDPELRRIQGSMKAELASTPRGRTTDGAAKLDAAIALWTNALIFAELSSDCPHPVILWVTDDTSRTWLGHTIGGVGGAGDNPDAIFRQSVVEGAGRYEIIGRFHRAHRPAQFVAEGFPGDVAHPKSMMQRSPSGALVEPFLMTDRDLVVRPDGTFRITLGEAPDGPNHVATRPGPITLLFRDMLADWNQRPCDLAIRRIDRIRVGSFDLAELRRRVHAHLSDYVRFWSAYPDTWLGGLKANTASDPMGRPGGWGLISGLRFKLAAEEAIVVNIGRGGAAYTGFQVMDPWMLGADARQNQVCLNLSQSTPDADGNFTYVISPTDPGVANWLDTAGLHEGFGIIRWQGLPAGATNAGLLREFRITRLSELGGLRGVALISAEQRKTQLARRADSYNSRTT